MSPRRFVVVLALAGVLPLGCAIMPAVGPGKGASPGSAPPRATRPPGPGATPTPAAPHASGAPAPATPAPAAGGSGKLRRPPGGTVPLRGRVLIDASYAVARGGALISDKGGAVVSNHGSSVLALGGARLEAGGRLVANNGGSVLADGGGNVIAPGGAGLARDLGGGLLIANNGGALVAKAKYAVAQATLGAPAGAATAPAVGQTAPAAGMLVSVVSLRTRSYMPLGEDAAGQPVYAVYSNAEGAYEVFLPAGEEGNVLVVANPPDAADPRLAYNVLAAPAADAPAEVDELTALASRYLRQAFTGRLADMLRDPAFAVTMLGVEETTSDEGKAELSKMFVSLGEAGKRGGIDADTSRPTLEAKAQRIVDGGLAEIAIAAIVADARSARTWQGPPKPALDAMRGPLRELLDGTARRFQAEPGYFSRAFLLETINAPIDVGQFPIPLEREWEILKPSDFGDFMLVEYFGKVRVGSTTAMRRAFRAILGSTDPRDDDPDPAIEQRARGAIEELRGGAAALMVALARRYNEEPAFQARCAAILAE